MERVEEVDFVNGLPEEYQCHVCLSLLEDPHLTTCCGHHFCKECICKVAQANHACPLCKTEGFVAVVDKNVHRKIRALPVRCQYHSKGCEWQGELRGLEEHLNPVRNACKFSDVVCSKGCGQTLLQSHLETHLLNECPNRDQECGYCKQMFPFSTMSNHLEIDCSSVPVPCPNGCSELVLRGAVSNHCVLCPKRLMDCEFSHFGCDIKLQSQHVGKHMEEFSHKHLHMVAECCSSLKQKIVERDAQLAQLSSQLLEKEKEIECLKKELSRQYHEMHTQRNQILESFSHLEQMCNSHLSISKQIGLEDIHHRIAILEAQVPVPPYYFTVSNFALHKQGGTQWTCPSFFLQVGGYKMAIEVSANGEGVGRDTHVSVYIRIMHGEYDGQLRWPLCASVTLQLISQSGNEAHHEKTTPQYEWSQVTSGVIGVGWGWDKFISHSDLQYNSVRRAEYLKNDRLNFRVICVDEAF